MNRGAVVGIVVVAAAGAGWLLLRDGKSGGPAVTLRTGKVEKGEVVEGVAASGTVQPVVLVQVGTQISGVIERIHVDFNARVKAGETIAVLDSRRLRAQIAQDEAAIARARADVERVKAVVAQAGADVLRVRAQADGARADENRVKALREQSEKDLARQRALAERKLAAPAEMDAAVANLGSLDAQLAAAGAAIRQADAQIAVAAAAVKQDEAQLAVAEASVKQALAQLDADRVSLEYATILSPVDGVVVSRNVDVGQTVAASLSAPTLFVIAQDLTKVQVQTSVAEADVGRLHQGQKARFTVDAHPDRPFDGTVSQVRLAATTVQNVVTYTVVVDAENPKSLLLPGMTANVVFEVARSGEGVLKVPTSALRVQPGADLVEGAAPAKAAPPAGGGGGAGRRGSRGPREGTVYLPLPGNRLRAVAVRPGISDGTFTVVEPVEAGALSEGTEVVTSVQREEEAAATNPFAPPRMSGGSRGGGR